MTIRIQTVRELKELLDDVPDHWLDTGLTFEFEGHELSVNEDVAVNLLSTRNTLGFFIETDRHLTVQDQWAAEEEELESAMNQQKLASTVSLIVSDYGNRQKILKNAELPAHWERWLADALWEAGSLQTLFSILTEKFESERGDLFEPYEQQFYFMVRNALSWAERCSRP